MPVTDRAVVIVMLALLLCSCAGVEDVEIVAVVDEPTCAQGKMTVMQTANFGRLQRCGYWGKVGDVFKFNVHSF